MARIRTIKPDFWTDSKTGTLSPEATKLFIGMLNFSDDYGVLEHDISALKAKIFPFEVGSATEVVGKPLLDELLPKGLVILFKWNDSPRAYLFIKNFHKHQRVDHPSSPLLAGFEKKDIQDFVKSLDEPSMSPHRVVGEPSESPRSLREGKGKDRKGKERIGEEGMPINITSQWYKDLTADYPNLNIDDEYQRFIKWEKDNPRKNHKKAFRNWLNNSDKWQKEKGHHGRPKGNARQDHGPDKFAGIGKEVDPVPQV